MVTIETRLKKLETQKLPHDYRYKVIHHQLVRPSPNGPEPCGDSYNVIAGNTFDSKDYSTNEQLMEAVSQDYFQVYGKPMFEEAV